MILSNKTILITGVGKGIGREIFYQALKEGAFIYAITRSKKDFKNYKNLNSKIFFGNVCNLNLIKKIFKHSKKNNKKIVGIVNNAGIRFRKPFKKINQKELLNVFNNNFFSNFQIIQEYVKYLGKDNKEHCSIVNIGSIVGKLGFSELSAYASSKSALMGLTKSLSVELVDKKIRINIINPGFIKTSYYKNFKERKKNLYKWTLSRIPSKKWGEPKDISEFILFLLSDKSKYFNGEDITIDGGWTNS
tara:strand:- start:168 stop:908 length:741 start_codon:yes stop_codon:yes gene_type:complete